MSQRVAALYDIHGNLPALEAVLDEVRRERVDRVVVGGDVVPGPMAGEALARLRTLDVPVEFIQGNCEVAVLAEIGLGDPAWYRRLPEPVKSTMRWQARQLDVETHALFATWPLTCRVTVRELGDVLFCHATPRHENEIFTALTPAEALQPIFDAAGAAVVVCGHTHMPFDRIIGTTRVLNGGSIGMPFGEPGADWLLLGPGVEFRHTPYDLDAAAARIRATDFPEPFADRYLLHPPAADAMLKMFTAASLQESAGRW
jgi:predicted phosphodiesterase